MSETPSLSAAERTATESSAATVDLSKIKLGDGLLIRATAMGGRDSEGFVLCRVGTPSSDPTDATVDWRFDRQDIASHTPKALEVGDRVKVSGPRNVDVGEVVAVRGTKAWIDWPAPSCWADKIDFTELERVLERVDV